MPGVEPLPPAALLVLLACAVGLVLIPLGLPGLWLIVGSAVLYRLVSATGEPGIAFLLFVTSLAALAEVAESLLGVAAARRFGASRWGMWGAFLGGIVGGILFTPLLPVVGTLLGAFAGAFVGAFVLEWWKSRAFRVSWRAGIGAFLGRIAAVAVKLAVGLAIAVMLLLRIP